MSSKNLVVMPFGNQSLESDWIFNTTARDFDVVLLFYHSSINNQRLTKDNPAYTLFELKDFKWLMIQNLFQQKPEYLSRYDYFFFPDDDIEIDLKTIRLLFSWIKEFDLKLSQPVLTRDSFKSWRVLRKKYFSGVRYLSTVELMCPAMHQAAVVELLPTFSLNESGWGIDILWGEMIRKKFGPKSIAVFDVLGAKHTKPVGKGELYNKLGKSSFQERDEIFERYNISIQKIYRLNLPENSLLTRMKSYFQLKKSLKP
jgi:hypothetical protein